MLIIGVSTFSFDFQPLISSSFWFSLAGPEKPTARAITERVVKIRNTAKENANNDNDETPKSSNRKPGRPTSTYSTPTKTTGSTSQGTPKGKPVSGSNNSSSTGKRKRVKVKQEANSGSDEDEEYNASNASAAEARSLGLSSSSNTKKPANSSSASADVDVVTTTPVRRSSRSGGASATPIPTTREINGVIPFNGDFDDDDEFNQPLTANPALLTSAPADLEDFGADDFVGEQAVMGDDFFTEALGGANYDGSAAMPMSRKVASKAGRLSVEREGKKGGNSKGRAANAATGGMKNSNGAKRQKMVNSADDEDEYGEDVYVSAAESERSEYEDYGEDFGV